AAVGGTLRVHIDHVRHAVDLLLDRRSDGLLDGGGIGAREDGRDDDGRRRDLREAGDRQAGQRDAAGQRDNDGEHRRENRAIDEEVDHVRPAATLLAASGAFAIGLAFTAAPGLRRCTPSTTTTSPALSPCCTCQPLPMRGPICTSRCCALPSASTIQTSSLPYTSC